MNTKAWLAAGVAGVLLLVSDVSAQSGNSVQGQIASKGGLVTRLQSQLSEKNALVKKLQSQLSEKEGYC